MVRPGGPGNVAGLPWPHRRCRQLWSAASHLELGTQPQCRVYPGAMGLLPVRSGLRCPSMDADLGFEHFIYDDPMDGTRMMAWLLANPDYQEPSIALIWKGAHYIVIRGVRAIGDPAAD